jgi:hypothetical protein
MTDLYQLQHTIGLINSDCLQRTAEATSRANEAIMRMSLRSTQEARTMRILTILALIYVPGSFIAVSYDPPTRIMSRFAVRVCAHLKWGK